MSKRSILNEIRTAEFGPGLDIPFEDLPGAIKSRASDDKATIQRQSGLLREAAQREADVARKLDQARNATFAVGQVRRTARTGSTVQIVTVIDAGPNNDDVRNIGVMFHVPNDPARPFRFFSPAVVRRWEVVDG